MPRSHFTQPDALLRALACGNQHCVCHRAVARGNGLTHCPAHDDEHPSLSVTTQGDRLLWNCKAGCDQRVVSEAMRQFFVAPERGVPDVKARETVYDYGKARHIRLDFPNGTKRMWWEPGGTRMADLPLWNGDLLRESRFDNEPVLLVEGEKDANRGVMFGFCTVSLPGGSSQRDFGKALEPLRDRVVVVIPDHDRVGKELMAQVTLALIRAGVAVIKVIDLPPSSHDLGDFLDEAADGDPRGAMVALRFMVSTADVIYQSEGLF